MEQIPDGWKPLTGAINHPKGMRWISNGKSRFSKDYRHALVPEEVAYERNKADRRGNAEETAGTRKASVHNEDVQGNPV